MAQFIFSSADDIASLIFSRWTVFLNDVLNATLICSECIFNILSYNILIRTSTDTDLSLKLRVEQSHKLKKVGGVKEQALCSLSLSHP